MKKFSIIFLYLIFFQSLNAEINLDENLSLNKEIIYGKLDNNLTYYIKKNSNAKKKASISLIVKAGSLMEDDDQLGIAHLIEHMTFNGTKNYPKNEIDKYLSSIGLQIGSDYNASTGFETTSYSMEIPTDDISKIEKGIHILSEMVGFASLEDSSFEKERKIVEEEWRSRLGKNRRLFKEFKKYLYKNSKFSEREPIGDMKIIRNFSYDVAKRFYKDWYRPNLMGVIVVGDFDPLYIESVIIKHFNILENKSYRPLTETLLPKYNDSIFLNQSDKEQTSILFNIKNRKKKLVKDTVENARTSIIHDLIISIVNNRFNELNNKVNLDFDLALINKSSLTSKTNTFNILGILKEDEINEGLVSILTELERIKQNGFIKEELEIYKKKSISFSLQSLKSKKTRDNKSHISEISRNFLEDEFVIGEEREFKLVEEIHKTIFINDLNDEFKHWFKKDDRLINFRYPQKIINKISKNEFLAIEERIKKTKLKQYEFALNDKPLIEKKLALKSIVSEKEYPSIDTVELNLANGIKVFLKQTKNKINSFQFKAQSLGGYSHVSLDEYYSAKSTANLINYELGYGSFSKNEIKKKIDDQTNVNIWLTEFYEGLEGGSKTEKAEELFKLIYLRFTPLEIDKTVFQNFISSLKESKRNDRSNYKDQFYKKVTEGLCKNDNRCKSTEFEDIEKIKLKSIKDFYNNRFANSSNFVFTFVGDFEIEKIKPYIQKYLGNLPSIDRKESYIDNNIIFNGSGTFELKKNTEKNAVARYIFSSPYINLPKNRATIYLANIILNRILKEEIRGSRELVYSIGSARNLINLPKYYHLNYIYFNSDPKNIQKIYEEIDKIILKVKNGKFEDNYIADAQKKLNNDLLDSKQKNSFWLSTINLRYFSEENFKTIVDFEKTVNSVNKLDIVNYFNKTFNENFLKASFLPNIKNQ
jgi:zinc protease